jgi:hypothetical protein
MGCTESYQLPPHFQAFQSWPAQRVSSMIKAFVDGEYDWGIDHTVIMSLTGQTLDEAKVIIKVMSKGESVTINAASFLVAVIMLSEPNRRADNSQLALIFEVFDFSMAGSLSFDEFTIMLLCMISTQGIIISRAKENPDDSAVVSIAKAIYEKIGKDIKAPILYQEVLLVYKEYFTSHQVSTIDTVYDRFMLGTSVLEWRVEDEEDA